ncbi:MAG TPA: DUF1553 domain-containing protein, partial [Candidatus Acidoferrum sp.]|nr:DUF1553 domain-containing protein [Candidatus Acidoferrum sp.]
TLDFSAGAEDRSVSAQWIWSNTNAHEKAAAETIYLRKTFHLEKLPEQAFATVACDNSFKLFVNGTEVASGKDYGQPNFINLRSHLRAGENLIAVRAVNNTAENKPPAGEVKESDANPAGFIFIGQLRGAEISELISDSSWLWSKEKVDGWQSPEFQAPDWKPSATLGYVNLAPWTLAAKLKKTMSLAEVHGQVRSSLVASDPLMAALNRPSREQVTTSRPSAATTLQALELTNGETLNQLVKRSAEKLLATPKVSTGELVEGVFVKAIGRKPTSNELKLAGEFTGSPATREGVEDLLWSVAMLPEFQLIY